jgi:NAD+ synthase (glutamine-hydrolysing)
MNDGFVKVASATPAIRVADPAYNGAQVASLMQQAAAEGVKLVVFPELCLTGYTCGDLFLQKTLLRGALDALCALRDQSRGLDLLAIVGVPIAVRGRLFNCAAALYDGRILALVPKQHLPNYGEFYEKRHFVSGAGVHETVLIDGDAIPLDARVLLRHAQMPELAVGIELCEDLWVPNPPSVALAMAGATVICNPSASDELVTKDDYRRELVRGQSARLVCGYLYADAGEGESSQDLVYTGHDLICENGATLAEANFRTGLVVSELDIALLDSERRRMGTFHGEAMAELLWGGALTETTLTRHVTRTPFVPSDAAQRSSRCEQIITLQSLGLRKRIAHTNAGSVVIGVSGGLDSTLAMLVAVKAMDLLGRDRRDVIAVTMPCFGTTKRTRSNAEILAETLGATLRTVDITAAVQQHFRDIGHDPELLNVTYENSQARERTQVLMDIANQTNGFVVGTGDLSELALGWATYNGDHMSMYAVNTSVPKTLVRHLVQYVADTCGIPALAECLRSILDTPVSPELLPAKDGEIAQITEDLVGPYALHDFFLYHAIRRGCPPKKVYRLAQYAFAGEYDAETILRWLRTFYRRFFAQQFKRSCLPDGPKVGSVTLSPRGDWRMPSDAVANLWLAELETL